MIDLASQDDVESLWRALSDDESNQVDGLLRFASSIVRAAVPSIDARIVDGTLDPQIVADVIAMMVIRALRNPSGVTQENIGPVGYTLSTRVAAGYLYLDPSELALLGPQGPSTKGFGNIRLVPGLA